MTFTRSTSSQGSVIPLGFILVIGIIIIFGSIVTTTTLPVINEDREIQSHNELRTDMLQLSAQTSSASTINAPITVVLGSEVGYLFQNTKTSQQLESTPADILEVSNAENTATGSPYNYQKQQTIFTVSRNYYYQGTSQEYAYENGIIISQPKTTQPGNPEIIPQSTPPLIQNNQINLYHLKSAPDQTENPPSTVTIKNTNDKTTTITNTPGTPIELTIPTRLSQTEWESQLEQQRTTNGGQIQSISYQTTPTTETNTLTIELQQGTTYTISEYTITIT